jgi:hypothetical protein
MFKPKSKTVDSVLSAFSKTLEDLRGVHQKQLENAEEKRADAADLIAAAKEQEAEAKKHEAEAARAEGAIVRFEDFFSQLPKSAF